MISKRTKFGCHQLPMSICGRQCRPVQMINDGFPPQAQICTVLLLWCYHQFPLTPVNVQFNKIIKKIFLKSQRSGVLQNDRISVGWPWIVVSTVMTLLSFLYKITLLRSLLMWSRCPLIQEPSNSYLYSLYDNPSVSPILRSLWFTRFNLTNSIIMSSMSFVCYGHVINTCEVVWCIRK